MIACNARLRQACIHAWRKRGNRASMTQNNKQADWSSINDLYYRNGLPKGRLRIPG